MLKKLKIIVPSRFKRKIKGVLQNSWESCIYLIVRSSYAQRMVRHIVFVCKGNLCRSSFAENYLKLLFSDQIIKIESCGLDVDQGGFTPQDAVMVGKEFGVDLSMNYSKGLAACDLPNADLIVTMEYKQYRRLKNIFPENTKKIRLLGEFLPWPECLWCNIFDPYGLGPIEFRKCFRDIQRALNILKYKIDHNC